MGAFIMISADYRFGIEGDFQIGMNEVMIGISAPQFAMELARFRLSSAHFNRTAILGEMFDPKTACDAGFLDEVVPASALLNLARTKAASLGGINMEAHRTTKHRLRSGIIKLMQEVAEAELTLENARKALGQ